MESFLTPEMNKRISKEYPGWSMKKARKMTAKTKKKKKKKIDKRGLFRVSWVESRFAWRVKNGQETLALLSLQSDNTKAATYRGAIKNIKKTNKLNWDLLSIARVEQYDYDDKEWKVVQELKPTPRNYRDYPASGPFQELVR